MFDFDTAPYLELENYPSPKDGKFIYIPMNDEKKIRLAYWKHDNKSGRCSGTVLLQQGHNEFIEKYFETIQELIDRNFNVICFDWRGQGMSDRMIEDNNKQYIEDFSIHCEDIEHIIRNIIKKKFPDPLIGIGHSMGGHLLLLTQEKNQKEFKSIFLSAPMLGFKYEKFLFLLSNLMYFFGKKTDYFPFSNPNMGKETPFYKNGLTSDHERYKRTQKLVRNNPSIRLWGITNAWVHSVKKSLNKIRKKNWQKKILTPITIINPIEDKVVYSKKTQNLYSSFIKCEIYNIEDCEHEILMEKDNLRSIFWKLFDDHIKN